MTVNLAEGENVNCVFTNTRRGTVVINKTAVGGNDTFGYTATGTDLGNFNITTSGGTGTQTFTNVRPGAKTVLESAPPTGWVFTSLVCSDPGDSGTTTTGQTANIDLDPGETVTCTYTNTKQGTVVINKTAVGGDATFAYTGTGAGVERQLQHHRRPAERARRPSRTSRPAPRPSPSQRRRLVGTSPA